MASRNRVVAGTVAAVAGVVLLVAVTAPAGGFGRSGALQSETGTTSTDGPTEPSFQVTETYTPEDPQTQVVEPSTVGERATTLIIPRIKLRVPIIKGTDDEALARGVGLWENDTEPGGKGNYVLAGHRVTHGEPFADLPELQPGDRVIIETATYRIVYVMDTPGDAYRVDDTELWPTDPLPKPMRGGPNRILTLITCAETFHTDDRFIAFGHLASISLREGADTIG